MHLQNAHFSWANYKRVIVLLSLTILFASTLALPIAFLNTKKAYAAINQAASSTCSNAGATSISCTVTAPTSGNTMVAVIGTRNTATGSVSSITQTGATWAKAGESINVNGVTVDIWYANNVSGAGTAVTINLSGTYKASAVINEYSGLVTSSVLDQAQSGNSTGSSTAPTTGTTGTTTSTNELWIGGMSSINTNTYSLETNGFTEIAESASTGGNATTRNNAVFYSKIANSTGTASVSSTLSGTQQWTGYVATFKGVPIPTQIAFTTSARTLTAGTCSGAANIITFEAETAGGVPAPPSNGSVIRITSNSPGTVTIYSDSSCATPVTNGDFTFNGTETSKSFYITDTRKSTPTWTLTATKQSGPETLSNGTQSITVNAGAVTRLVTTLPGETFTDGVGNSGSASAQTAGSSFNVTKLSATDAYFNVNTGYSGAKTLAYTGPGNAPNTTSPSYTTAVSFTSGQSTTTLATTLYRAETTTLTVTDAGSYGYASSSLTVNPGVINNYAVVGATPTIAGVCATANSITARDQYNNTIGTDASVVNMTTTGTGISFYTTSGCSSITTQYTLSSGTATFFFKSTKKQSGFTITATKNLDTPTGSTSSLVIDPAPVSTILVQLPNQSFVDGTGISGSSNFTGLRTPNATASTSFTVSLKAVDAFNNLVDTGTNNYTGSKTISWSNSTAGNAPDSTAPSFPVGAVTFTNGSASGQSITYHNAATGRTVRADDTVTPVTGTASSTFIVQAGSTASYALSAGTSQTAGVAFNATITAIDAHQNNLGALYAAPAGSYTWSTTAAAAPDSTAPNLGSLLQTDFSNGVATKSITLYKAQSGVTLTAAEPGPSTVTGTSAAITVATGAISGASTDSSVTGSSTVVQNSPLTVTITLVDTWHNPEVGVAAANIIVNGTNSPSITQPGSATNASGQTTASLTWAYPGSQTVSVQISGIGLVQNDGVTADSDGFLDNTLSVAVTLPVGSSALTGGTIINGGTKLQ